MFSAGRETFLIQLPSVEDSSSGPGFEFGISAVPYRGTLTILGGKLVVSAAAAALADGIQASKDRAIAALSHLIMTTLPRGCLPPGVCEDFRRRAAGPGTGRSQFGGREMNGMLAA